MASDFEHHGTPIKSVRVERDGMRRIDGDDVYDTDAELDAAEEQAKLEWEAAVEALQTAREKVLDELEAKTGDPYDYESAYNRVESMGIYFGLPEQLVGANYDEYDSVYEDLKEITRVLGQLRVPSAADARAALADVKQAFKNCERFKNAGSNEDGFYDKSARRRVTRASPADKVTFLFKVPSSLDDDDAEVLQNALEALGWTTGVRAGETIEIDVPRDDVGEMSATLDDLGISFEKLSADEVDRSARRVTKSAPRWLEQFHQQLEAASAALGKAATILNEAPGDEDIDVSDRRDEVIKLYESVDMLLAAVVDGELHSYESDED